MNFFCAVFVKELDGFSHLSSTNDTVIDEEKFLSVDKLVNRDELHFSYLIADILISNSFNHYVNLDIMLSLGIPCVVAICAVHYCMQRLYAQHYKTEKELGRRK